MKGFWGAVTLVLIGVIVADLVTHQEGTRQAAQSLDQILKTTYTGMLGGPVQ